MADGFRVIDDKIKALRGLSRLGEEAPRDVTEIIRRDLAQQIEEGRDPEGNLWERRKDGEKPLRTAMDGIRMTSVGSVITARITKRHLVLHHYGYARGEIKRRILPSTLTKRMEAKIRAYYKRKIASSMAGEP